MFFNRNNSPQKPTPTTTTFQKAKLSQEALDRFVEKYQSDTDSTRIPYTTKAGKKIYFSPYTVLFKTPRSTGRI